MLINHVSTAKTIEIAKFVPIVLTQGAQARPYRYGAASSSHSSGQSAPQTDCVAGLRGRELGNSCTSHVFEIS
jgi:hypothetical protein